MFIGHVGAGLAFKKVSPKTNVAWTVFAALFLDLLLWFLVAIGVEEVIIPVNYDQIHFLRFGFPYSHSLIAAFFWSIFCTLIGRGVSGNWWLGIVMGAACMSHWFLDFIVHPPHMVLADPASTQVGLGLWEDMPVAMGIEGFITLLGLLIYFRSASNLITRRLGLVLFVMLVGIFTMGGQMYGPAPPGPLAIALSSLVMIVLVVGVIWALDRTKENPNLRSVEDEPRL